MLKLNNHEIIELNGLAETLINDVNQSLALIRTTGLSIAEQAETKTKPIGKSPDSMKLLCGIWNLV